MHQAPGRAEPAPHAVSSPRPAQPPARPLPAGFVQEALFRGARAGSLVTLCSATQDERWLGEFHEYARWAGGGGLQSSRGEVLRRLLVCMRSGLLVAGNLPRTTDHPAMIHRLDSLVGRPG